MAPHARLFEQIVQGRSNANIRFDQLCALLRALGFDERIRGSHHLFQRAGVEEMINLQRAAGKAKVYQVRQVRAILMKYDWDERRAVEKP